MIAATASSSLISFGSPSSSSSSIAPTSSSLSGFWGVACGTAATTKAFAVDDGGLRAIPAIDIMMMTASKMILFLISILLVRLNVGCEKPYPKSFRFSSAHSCSGQQASFAHDNLSSEN